jgi:hypothetical protein
MTAVTCDFDFFMLPLHEISNLVPFLLVIHYLVSTFDLIITHTSVGFSLLFPLSNIISGVECAAISIYVQEVN